MKYKKSLQCNTGIIVQDPLGIEKLLKVYKDKKVRNVFYELFSNVLNYLVFVLVFLLRVHSLLFVVLCLERLSI